MIFHEIVLAFQQLTSTIQTKLAKKWKPKHRFPLLKLPHLVLLNCIENLDVLEVTILSLLSKRAKSTAKLVNWNPLDIRFEYYISLSVSADPGRTWIIGYHDYYEDEEPSKYPYLESTLTGPKVEYSLFLKENENIIEDLTQMVEIICEVFSSPICEIDIDKQSLIEWIIKFQPTIRYVSIERDVIPSIENLDHILKSLKVTEHFHVGAIATNLRNFKQPYSENIRITEPIPCPSISIDNSYWVTLPLILNGANSVIRLYDSKLTPTDINTILKEWQMGTKLQNLEFLEIEFYTTQDLDSLSDEVSKGLDLTNGDENDGRPTTVKIHDELSYTLPSPEVYFNLIRNDGMVGSIFPSDTEVDSGAPSWITKKTLFNVVLQFQVWRRQV